MSADAIIPVPDWLRAEFPFTPVCHVTERGAPMAYLDEGPRSDEAVLMVHGNPTWSFYYRNLVNELRGQMRCIVPDHVGMGLSAKPENYPYTLEARIEDLLGLVSSLRLRRIHLVVHDWGGAIGFGVAARAPEKIGRIVVLNTAAFRSGHIPTRIALCRTPVIGPWLIRGLNGFAGPATRMAMHRRGLSEVERRGYLFPYQTWADRVAVNAFVQDIPMSDDHPTWQTLGGVEAALSKFRSTPAMIVWGGKDFCFNDHFLERWQEILPAAAVHRIADAGHYVIEDARAEAIPLISSFVARGA